MINKLAPYLLLLLLPLACAKKNTVTITLIPGTAHFQPAPNLMNSLTAISGSVNFENFCKQDNVYAALMTSNSDDSGDLINGMHVPLMTNFIIPAPTPPGFSLTLTDAATLLTDPTHTQFPTISFVVPKGATVKAGMVGSIALGGSDSLTGHCKDYKDPITPGFSNWDYLSFVGDSSVIANTDKVVYVNLALSQKLASENIDNQNRAMSADLILPKGRNNFSLTWVEQPNITDFPSGSSSPYTIKELNVAIAPDPTFQRQLEFSLFNDHNNVTGYSSLPDTTPYKPVSAAMNFTGYAIPHIYPQHYIATYKDSLGIGIICEKTILDETAVIHRAPQSTEDTTSLNELVVDSIGWTCQ